MKCKKDVQKLENSVKLVLTITDFSLCTVRPIYDKAKFTSRQNEVNPAFWLATHLSRSAVLITQEKSFFWLNNKSFNNQARWLYIDLDPLCVFYWSKREKKYLANKKPSWLQAWSIMHMYNCLTKQTGKMFTRPLKNCFPTKNGPDIHVAYLVPLSQ